MEFFKRNVSTIVLITVAAVWFGISLGTKDCPSCVITNVAKNAFEPDAETVTETKKPAPVNVNWSTVDTKGELITNSDLEGKVSVLVYWATWCGACKSEIPSLVALRNEFSDSDLEIIGLSVDEPHKDLDAFAKSKGINYRIARVNASVIETFGHADSIPTLIIVDQEGRIQFRHNGVVNAEALSERVRSLLAAHRMDRAFGS